MSHSPEVQKQITRIRATGVTYENAVRRVAAAQLMTEQYEAEQARQQKAAKALDKRTIVKLGPLHVGSYRRRRKK